jgi:hypothetical protein
MKKTLIILLISVFIPLISQAALDCPYGLIDDPAPGECGRYLDTNQDQLCDHSQIISKIENKTTPTKASSSRTYHFLQITLILIVLYSISRILLHKKRINLLIHKQIWNSILLFSFLISGILGILLIFQINSGKILKLPFNMIFWHVEIGIIMFVISVFHVIEHWKFFKNIIKRNF